MYTYNITFIIETTQEKDLLSYLRKELTGRLFNAESPARNPQLKKIIEAGGERPGPEHGLSIALSADFETEEKAHLWHDHIFLPALGDFTPKFGNNALFFVTLLEILAI